MKDVMIDIETVGTTPGSVILSIGAVYFSRVGIGDQFYVNIDPDSCEAVGLVCDPETVRWWDRQSEEAIAALLSNRRSLGEALESFTGFLDRAKRVWANSPSFDCVLLQAAYRAAGTKAPWSHRSERCVRTVKWQVPRSVTRVERKGVAHNALDDAIYQAEQVRQAMAALKGKW